MNRFAFIQMLWYSCSSIGLCCYFVHAILGYLLEDPVRFSASTRISIQNRVEVVVLLGRWYNEIKYSKYGTADIAHHTATLFGAYCAFNVKSCHDFAYILSHTNILHVPMLIWYFGCKKGCFLKSNSALKRACIFSFPHV